MPPGLPPTGPRVAGVVFHKSFLLQGTIAFNARRAASASMLAFHALLLDCAATAAAAMTATESPEAAAVAAPDAAPADGDAAAGEGEGGVCDSPRGEAGAGEGKGLPGAAGRR